MPGPLGVSEIDNNALDESFNVMLKRADGESWICGPTSLWICFSIISPIFPS